VASLPGSLTVRSRWRSWEDSLIAACLSSLPALSWPGSADEWTEACRHICLDVPSRGRRLASAGTAAADGSGRGCRGWDCIDDGAVTGSPIAEEAGVAVRDVPAMKPYGLCARHSLALLVAAGFALVVTESATTALTDLCEEPSHRALG
jgi:hypothetical protein